jgi:choline kinase
MKAIILAGGLGNQLLTAAKAGFVCANSNADEIIKRS